MGIDKKEGIRPTIRLHLRRLIKAWQSWLLRDVKKIGLDTQLLIGKMASWHVRSLKVITALQDVEFKVSSQWGEDGIIDWLIERANIPPALQTFIEFGVETYREANTRFLLENRNWRGLIMDGGSEAATAVITDGLYWKHDLTVRHAFITRENINELLVGSGLSGDIGLLSIDLDGNDYWIWEAINSVRPIIVVCEYNAVFGDIHQISVPYDSRFIRSESHYSNLYFGASIKAICALGSRKGYRFVGTTSAANDAFFVREDYAEQFVDVSLENIRALPSMARESRDWSGALTYVTGLRRTELLKDMPVINTETGERLNIGDLNLYSHDWLAKMGAA